MQIFSSLEEKMNVHNVHHICSLSSGAGSECEPVCAHVSGNQLEEQREDME